MGFRRQFEGSLLNKPQLRQFLLEFFDGLHYIIVFIKIIIFWELLKLFIGGFHMFQQEKIMISKLYIIFILL